MAGWGGLGCWACGRGLRWRRGSISGRLGREEIKRYLLNTFTAHGASMALGVRSSNGPTFLATVDRGQKTTIKNPARRGFCRFGRSHPGSILAPRVERQSHTESLLPGRALATF